MTINDVTGYLMRKGIPKQTIREIRMALTYDAVQQARDVQYDRILTGVAIVLRKEFGFGEKRIMRGLEALNKEFESILDPDNDWNKTMERLRDETGIIIRSGDDNRLVVECLTDDEKENYKYGSEKK